LRGANTSALRIAQVFRQTAPNAADRERNSVKTDRVTFAAYVKTTQSLRRRSHTILGHPTGPSCAENSPCKPRDYAWQCGGLCEPAKPGRAINTTRRPNTNAATIPRHAGRRRNAKTASGRCSLIEGHSQTDCRGRVPSKTPAPMGTLIINIGIGWHQTSLPHSPPDRFPKTLVIFGTSHDKERATRPNVDVVQIRAGRVVGIEPASSVRTKPPPRHHDASPERLGQRFGQPQNDVARKYNINSNRSARPRTDRLQLARWNHTGGVDRRSVCVGLATGAGGALLARCATKSNPTQPGKHDPRTTLSRTKTPDTRATPAETGFVNFVTKRA